MHCQHAAFVHSQRNTSEHQLSETRNANHIAILSRPGKIVQAKARLDYSETSGLERPFASRKSGTQHKSGGVFPAPDYLREWGV
jgi:hypothetical protein